MQEHALRGYLWLHCPPANAIK